MSDKKGIICQNLTVSSEEGKLLVSFNVDDIAIVESTNQDEFKVVVMASIFKHTLAAGYDVKKDLNNDDVVFQVQLPKAAFSKEVQLVVENEKSIMFEVSNKALTAEEKVTQYVPKVIIKEEQDEE
jgi:hypothetical protein